MSDNSVKLAPVSPGYNVYVGQRYVPKFYKDAAGTAQWDGAQSYEPLTIVINQGNSYTSRTFVPPNTNINDTNFWVPTGLFNAQLSLYEQRVDDIQHDVTEINETLNTINSDIFPIFIGDSYAENRSGIDNPWPIVTKNALNLSEYYIAAKGGASWAGVPDRMTFLQLLQSLENQIENKNKITHIIVMGGVNDAVTTTSSGWAAMLAFRNYVQSNYPNAVVYVGLCGWGTAIDLRNNIRNISAPIYNRGGFVGFQTMTNVFKAARNYNNFLEDGVHPNQQGLNEIGWCVAGYLKGGDGILPGITNQFTATETLNTANFSSAGLTFTEIVNQDICVVTNGGVLVSAVEINPGSSYSICTNKTRFIRPQNVFSNVMILNGFYGTSGSYKGCTVQISFDVTDVKLSVIDDQVTIPVGSNIQLFANSKIFDWYTN